MRLHRKIRFGLQLPFRKLVGVGLMLTRQCNLHCAYCKVREETSENITLEKWKSIVKKLYRIGHRHFVFTGGEPLLYPGALELIEWVYPYALTSLITNGTLLSETILARLSFLDFLSLSLDALSSDALFSKSQWHILPAAIAAGRKNGFTVETILVITSKNIREIPEMARRASDLGGKVLLSFIHSGDGLQAFRKKVPELEFRTPDDLEELGKTINELIKMKQKGYKIAESDNFLRDMLKFAKGEFNMPCYAGSKWLEVCNDGRLLPCHDGIKSDLLAWEIGNEKSLMKQLEKFIPKNCTCFYNCYYNYQYRKKYPFRSILHLLRT